MGKEVRTDYLTPLLSSNFYERKIIHVITSSIHFNHLNPGASLPRQQQ